jgi:hypothetical protein
MRELGVAGRTVSRFGETRYEPGPRFFELVRVLQSRQARIVEPGPDGPRVGDALPNASFYELAFPEESPRPTPLLSGATESAWCPQCSAEVEDWAELVSAWWDDGAFTWECPGCRTQTSPPRLDWRRGGGFARVWVDVWHVHEGEAEPSAELLSALGATTGGAWTFHYYRL